MADKVKNDSFVPSGSEGPNAAAKPRMGNKPSKAPAGNAGESSRINGTPAVLKKVNKMGVFKSGHRK